MISDDTGTPGDKRWEIETAFTWEHRPGGSVYQTPILDANYGAGSRIELNLELPWQWTFEKEGHEQGLGDTELAVKWRFIDSGENGISVSTYPKITFNSVQGSVRSGLVESDRSFFLPIEVCKNFGPIEANLEFGPEFHQAGGLLFDYGIVLGHQFTKRFEAMAEYHDTWFAEDHGNERIFDFGFRYELTEGRTLLFALGSGPRSTPEHTVTGVGYLGMEIDF